MCIMCVICYNLSDCFAPPQSVELDPSSLWEDEDSHQFYAGVTDIKPFVPAILFEGKKRGTSESSDSTPTPSVNGEQDSSAGKQEEEEGTHSVLYF